MTIGFCPAPAVGQALDLSGAKLGSLPLHRPELDLDLKSLSDALRDNQSPDHSDHILQATVKIRDFLVAFGPCVLDVQGALLNFANSADASPKEAAKDLREALSPLTEQLRRAAREYTTFLMEADKGFGFLTHTCESRNSDFAARTTPIVLLNLVVTNLSKVAAHLTPLAAGHGSIDDFVKAKEVSAEASNNLATVFTAPTQSLPPTIDSLSWLIDKLR